MADTLIPATPRLAATVLLLRDDPFQVLMVRRVARAADAFSAALVFPGGVVDPADRDERWRDLVAGADTLGGEEIALRIAACRETFEEVGILLSDRAIAARPEAGQDIAAFLRALGMRLPLDRLVHFGHWITPIISPRRFDTHFYLCRMPGDVEAVCDGQETVALDWLSPHVALDLAEARDGRMPFPTRMSLRRLAESVDVEDALAAARARPRFTVEPQAIRRDGRVVVTIPAEAGYGVTEDLRR